MNGGEVEEAYNIMGIKGRRDEVEVMGVKEAETQNTQ